MPEKSMPVILSIINLLCEATKSIMLYAFGYLANNISYKVGFTSLIIFFIISSVIFYIIIKHDKHLIKIEKRL